MELKLVRKTFTDNSTIGDLYVDDKFQCYTLEDKVRTIKKFGETAIPVGKYKVIINQSTRFKRLMPLILDVKGFTGIRIHSGNTDKDTEGCILVGTEYHSDFIGNSRHAFSVLFDKLQIAFDSHQDISLEVKENK